MSNDGISRIGNLVWDDTNKKWIPQTQSSSGGGTSSTVSISGVTVVNGRLPVDTELTIEGDVIVDEIKINSMPLTEVYVSGTVSASGVEVSSFGRLMEADDLVTTITYNEPDSRTTVGVITYESSDIGMSATETFASGVNYITITRNVS